MTNPTIDELAVSALALTARDRVALAQKLWESLDIPPAISAGMEAQQIATVRRRAEELKNGAVKGITHEEVIENARREIR